MGMEKPMNIRVLMIGPGEGVGGGICTLVDTIRPALEKRVSLHYLASVKNRPLKHSGKVSFLNLRIAISQYFRFFLALLKYRPNVIHLHTSHGLAWFKDTFYVMVAKVVGIHTILHIHGGNFDELHSKSPWLLQKHTCKIIDAVDAVVTVSQEWKNRLQNYCSEDRLYCFENCIDIRSIPLNSYCASSGRVNILFIGRIGPAKGIDELIEAVHIISKSVADIYVWLVGPEEKDGDMETAKKKIIEHRLEQVCELVGCVPHDQALEFYRHASFFVLPSRFEGLPMVILEALAAGLPIVATPVGGIPDVIHEGYNGFLVPVGNVDVLSAKMLLLVNDGNLRASMGARSREIAERDLDTSCYVNQLVQLYESVLAG